MVGEGKECELRVVLRGSEEPKQDMRQPGEEVGDDKRQSKQVLVGVRAVEPEGN